MKSPRITAYRRLTPSDGRRRTKDKPLLSGHLSIFYLLSSIFPRLIPPSPHRPTPLSSSQSPISNLQSLIFAPLIYTLLTLILTYPLIFNLTPAVPNDIGDPLLNTWILAWVSHALTTAPLNLFQANIFHPLPNTLAYSEHLVGTAGPALPLQLFFGEPILVYNLSLLATFPLAGWGMYLLALRWTGNRRAAFLAGLIFAFNPYRFAAIAHLQLLTIHWLPFALLFLDKILHPSTSPFLISLSPQFSSYHPAPPPISNLQSPLPPHPPLTLALTICLLGQLLSSWYLAVYTGLILGIYLLIHLFISRTAHSRLIPVLVSLAVTFCMALPFAWPYLSLLDDLRQARPLSLALSLAAQPGDFMAAAPFNRLLGPLTASLRSRAGFTEENTLFLGLVAPLLALASLGWVKARSKLAPAARATLLSLSLILGISLILTFPAPYATLAALLPSSTIIRVPARWIIPATFALSGLAAYGYLYLQSLISNLPISQSPNPQSLISNLQLPLTILLLLLETLSVPLPLAPVDNRNTLNPAYNWLAKQPDQLSLIELPLHSAPVPEFPEVKRLYASTRGWWPLVNGYSGYTPPRQLDLAAAVNPFPDPVAVTVLQNLAATFPPETLPLYVLIHPSEAPLDRSSWETTGRWQAERQMPLYPIGQFDGDYLYRLRLPEPNRFATPLTAFGQDRAIELLEAFLERSPIEADGFRLTLYWRATQPLATDYTVFVHLRAADGFVRAQADGPLVNGTYPTTVWPPGDIIQDIHRLPIDDPAQIDRLAIGLYDPANGERLPAFDLAGQRLPDDAWLIPFEPQ